MGVGMTFVVNAALPGLGNEGMKIELKLRRFVSRSPFEEAVDERL